MAPASRYAIDTRRKPSHARGRSKPRGPEPTTWVDRAVLALCGSILGFGVWTCFYLALGVVVLGRTAGEGARPVQAGFFDPLSPFWWGLGLALPLAISAMIAGEERMMGHFRSQCREAKDAVIDVASDSWDCDAASQD